MNSHTPFRVLHGRCLAFFMLLAAVVPSVMAQRTINDLSSRDLEFVLDADAGTTRDYHRITGSVTVRYRGELEGYNTRVVMGLVDEQDQAVTLVSGTDLTTPYNPGRLRLLETDSHQFDFSLDPDEALDPGKRYRILARLMVYAPDRRGNFRWLQEGSTVYDAPRRYFHFTNTETTDPAFNVLGLVENVTFDRDWRIATLGNDNRNFRATFDMRLLRYDEFNSLPQSHTVSFRLQLSLVDDLGATVAVAHPISGRYSFSQSLETHTRARLPTSVPRSVAVSFRPSAQLDPVNRRYSVKAELLARQTASVVFSPVSATTGPETRLLDYNGNLRFGSGPAAVTTVMVAAARTSVPYTVQPAYIDTYVDISSLSLSAGDATFTGSPGVLNARLLASGLATYGRTETTVLSNPAGFGKQRTSYRGLAYELWEDITLGPDGASGQVRLLLPAGMGIWRQADPPGPGTVLDSILYIGGGVPLNAQLVPLDNQVIDYPGRAWVVEESKPVATRVSSLTLRPATGRIDLGATGEVNHPETTMRRKLELAPTSLPGRIKRSNADYWLLATGVDTSQPAYIRQSPRDPAPGSNAALNASFKLGSGNFLSHFPEAKVTSRSSTNLLVVLDDLISPVSRIESAAIELTYLAGDPDASPSTCGGAAGDTRTVTLRPTTTLDSLLFTPTGGLVASCETALTGGHALAWGSLGSPLYAFRTQAFRSIDFYMPGTFYPQGALASGDSDLGHQYTPLSVHVTGYVDGQWRFAQMEAPGTADYRTNSRRADYAGINLRVANEADGFLGYSIISGQDAGSYPLKTHCRYYARKSGVTGIHDAFGGPTGAMLYGFASSFSSYGLSFLDCRVVDSVTDGDLVVPYPSEFALPLEEIRFTSTGRPLDARLPAGIGWKPLKYWKCQMLPSAVAFSSTDPCNTSAGLMRVQAGVDVPRLGGTLYGELGFRSNGWIAHSQDGVPGLTSRLKAPSHVSIPGPARPAPAGEPASHESYTLTPVTEVYLNNYADFPSDQAQGFINLAGKLDVAFFRDLEVVVHTSPEENDPVHLMGDWGGAFTDPDSYDPTNRGFPEGGDPGGYRRDPTAAQPIHARRTWLDAVEFDYPVKWDYPTGAFRVVDGWTDSVNLLVLEAEHRLDYLSAEQAKLSFGLSYEGIPKIDLGGMLVNAIDEHTGVLTAIEEGLQDGAAAALYAGSQAFGRLLNDSFDELFGPRIEEVFTRPAVVPTPDGPVSLVEAQFLRPLTVDPGGLAEPGSLRQESEWDGIVKAGFNDASYGLRQVMLEMATEAGGQVAASTLVGEMIDGIDEVVGMLDVFIGPVPPGDPTGGGLLVAEGRTAMLVYALVDQLADEDLKRLLGIEAGGAAFMAIDRQVTAYLESHAGPLATLRTRLERLRDDLLEVRDQLADGGTLEGYLLQRFTEASGAEKDSEFSILIDLLVADMHTHLRATYGGDLAAFANNANRRATGEFLVRRVRDRLAGAAIAAALQKLMREQLQDLQSEIDATVGSVFSTLNQVIRDVVNEAAGSIDGALSPLNGALSKVAAAGSVDGSAVIRGDRLEHLRLDARLELTLDEPMVFQGYLEINQLRSGGGREIEIGGIDVPLKLFDSEADFTIIGRVALDGDGTPVGFGGSIEMTRGNLEFEAFTITELGAALQLDADEQYFAARLGMAFDDYAVVGGLFVGHSDSLDPLLLVDPEVGEIIPLTSITGIYVYGEAPIPIVDFGCMFKVSGGIGAGFFYFAEGPTYGGKIKAELRGEALCVVTVKGDIVLIGVKSDIFRFDGRATIEGKAGKCPFCVSFKKKVSFTYDEHSGFDADW